MACPSRARWPLPERLERLRMQLRNPHELESLKYHNHITPICKQREKKLESKDMFIGVQKRLLVFASLCLLRYEI